MSGYFPDGWCKINYAASVKKITPLTTLYLCHHDLKNHHNILKIINLYNICLDSENYMRHN